MIGYTEEEKTEPTEITDLKNVLYEEYPNTEVTYTDYTEKYDDLSERGIGLPPSINNGEELPEAFINPIGAIGGHFRAELFIHASKNSLPDPENENNRILIYPSYDKEKKLSKLRLLKYPLKVLENTQKEFDRQFRNLKLPTDISRIKAIPKIRTGIKPQGLDHVVSADPVLNSSRSLVCIYQPEKIERIKKDTKPLNWGKNTILPYKNRDGEKILLVTEK